MNLKTYIVLRMKDMKPDKLRWALLLGACLGLTSLQAQELWTADQCMEYAMQHNHTVKQRELEWKNSKLDKMKAWGNFLPGISAGASAAYNFGRSVDPETNTYTDVSTFGNSYRLEAGMYLFKGGSLVAQWKQARVAALMGKAALQEERDQVGLDTYQAYIELLYQQGAVELARKKLAESDSLLYKTRLQEELGLKGRTDVLQMEAQRNTDAYTLTHAEGVCASALLALKQKMNYPLDAELLLAGDEAKPEALEEGGTLPTLVSSEEILACLGATNPTLRSAQLMVQSRRQEQRIAWAGVMPTVSLYAGISTSYFKQLHADGYSSFGTQLKNNKGEYVSVSLSIPIFNRLSTLASVRQSRNNYRIASQQLEEQRTTLHKLAREALQDCDNYRLETLQMEKKVESDSLAYAATCRKYEEGLSTGIEVQTSGATLHESRIGLLQSRLTYAMKRRLAHYYLEGNLF